MSAANVEIVKSIYEAFARRDLQSFFVRVADDARLVQSEEVPWGGTYQGKAGVQAFLGKLTGAIHSTVTVERCIDAGDHVVVIGRTAGKVIATGAAFDVPIAHVWELRDGLAVSAHFMIDNPAMLAALKAKG